MGVYVALLPIAEWVLSWFHYLKLGREQNCLYVGKDEEW